MGLLFVVSTIGILREPSLDVDEDFISIPVSVSGYVHVCRDIRMVRMQTVILGNIVAGHIFDAFQVYQNPGPP